MVMAGEAGEEETGKRLAGMLPFWTLISILILHPDSPSLRLGAKQYLAYK